MNDKSSIIEAFLFSEGGPVRKSRLMQLTNTNAEELEQALHILSNRLTGGLTIVQSETEAALVIAAGANDLVKEAQKKELGDEIGDAGLEVLSIILYRGPSTRAQIDYIRGVNTASTMRNLLSRGLIERVGNPLDGREYIYRPTTELIAHLGVKAGEELPDFQKISTELKGFEKQVDTFKNDARETHQ